MSSQDFPLYSCIIPVHNGIEHLDRCMASVFEQTEKRFEVIVIDDGSTDGSHRLIMQWAVRYPERVRVMSSGSCQARGIVATYRMGASLACGHYLAFLEQDDYWDQHFLESKSRLIEATISQGVSVIFSPYRVRPDGLYGLDMVLRSWLLSLEFPHDIPFNNTCKLMRYNNVACFSAFICKRSHWKFIPPPPDTRILYFDWWVLAHLSLMGDFLYDPSTHVHWRCSPLTTLGQQSFRDHQAELTSFLVALHESIVRESLNQGKGDSQLILHQQKVLPLQIKLIHECSTAAIIQGLAKSPNWTLRMLISLLVNRLKKPG